MRSSLHTVLVIGCLFLAMTSRDARVWSTMGGGRVDDDDEPETTTLGNQAITFNSTLFGRKILFGGVTGIVCGAGFGGCKFPELLCHIIMRLNSVCHFNSGRGPSENEARYSQ